MGWNSAGWKDAGEIPASKLDEALKDLAMKSDLQLSAIRDAMAKLGISATLMQQQMQQGLGAPLRKPDPDPSAGWDEINDATITRKVMKGADVAWEPKARNKKIESAAEHPAMPPTKPVSGDVHREGNRWWRRNDITGWTRFEPTEEDRRERAIWEAAEQWAIQDKITQSLAKGIKASAPQMQVHGEALHVGEVTSEWDQELDQHRVAIRLYPMAGYGIDKRRELRIGRGFTRQEIEVQSKTRKSWLAFMEVTWAAIMANNEITERVSVAQSVPSSGGWYEAGGQGGGVLAQLTRDQYGRRVAPGAPAGNGYEQVADAKLREQAELREALLAGGVEDLMDQQARRKAYWDNARAEKDSASQAARDEAIRTILDRRPDLSNGRAPGS